MARNGSSSANSRSAGGAFLLLNWLADGCKSHGRPVTGSHYNSGLSVKMVELAVLDRPGQASAQTAWSVVYRD